jgi:hypothetical protein
MSDIGDIARRVCEDAIGRYAHFDTAAWVRMCAALSRLEAGLEAGLAAAPVADRTALITTWLELGAAGLGAGTYVAGSADDPFAILWERLVPDGLGAVEQRAQALADAFNLGENLAREQGWRRMIFVDGLRRLEHLSALREMLTRRVSLIAAQPTRPLGDAPQMMTVDLSAFDLRFLPGAVGMLAPTVFVVCDRERTDDQGQPLAVAAWAPEGEAPTVLGAVRAERIERRHEATDLWTSGIFASVRTQHRAAASVVTSQRIWIAVG